MAVWRWRLPRWRWRAQLAGRSRISPPLPELGFLFGEDQARYIVTAAPENAEAIRDAAETAGVACEIIGVTGGDSLTLGVGTAILLDRLVQAHEGWLPGYMEGANP